MGNHKIFFTMFKFAALAVVSAYSREELNESIEMWKYKVHEKEIHGLEKHAKALEKESKIYEHQLAGSKHGQVFGKQFESLVHTEEFTALAKYV